MIAAPDRPATRADVQAALDGTPRVFTGWNMAGADLTGLDLHGYVFERCLAGGANLSSCDLTETRFTACDLNNALCHWTTLSAALFQDCKLTGIQIVDARSLGLGFERCLLVSAHLHGLSFRRARLDGLDFQGADLTEADFRDAVLTGCSLREANLMDARFEGADLRGADLGSLAPDDVRRFKGAVISKLQAATIARSLGLKVV